MTNRHNLYSLQAEVEQYKPNSSYDLRVQRINARVRTILKARLVWASLIVRGVLSVPAPFSQGRVSLTSGSKVISLTGATWPVNDLVNTTSAAATDDVGVVEIEPADMTGIADDGWLVIDSGASQEILPVLGTTDATFLVNCRKPHAAGFAIKASSLAGRQVRLDAAAPIMTVTGVLTSTTLSVEHPWGIGSIADQPYRISKILVSLGTRFEKMFYIIDPVNNVPLDVTVMTIQKLNLIDPRRMQRGNARCFIPYGPSPSGSVLHEIWPSETASDRQYPFAFYQNWPEMVGPNDRPPHFIDPGTIIAGAIADLKRHKVDAKDPFYDPAGAQAFERQYQEGLLTDMRNDDAKMPVDLDQWFGQYSISRGSDWAQTHVIPAYDFPFV